MSEIALTIGAGTRHQGRMEDGERLQGWAVTETFDFVSVRHRDFVAWYFAARLRRARRLADVPRPWPAFAAIARCGATWIRSSTTRGSSRSTTSSHQRQRIFSASCNSGGGTFTQLEGGTAQRRRHHRTRHRAAARHRRGDPPPPPAGVGGGDRPIPNPPHNSARPGHQRMTPRPAAQPRTECRCPGRFPDQPGAAMTSRSRHRAAQPGPRHTDTAAPPCAAAASPLTMASEYLVDNRSVPS